MRILKAFLLLIGVFILLFLMFPAEYVKYISEEMPIESMDRAALKLTEAYFISGVRYGCGHHMFFGYHYPFGGLVPGISESELDRQLRDGAQLAHFFISDVNFHLSIGVEGGAIEKYNAMVLAKCR